MNGMSSPASHQRTDPAECPQALQAQRIIELGWCNARLSRDLLRQYPQCHVTGLEVDRIQHAANMGCPAERLEFVEPARRRFLRRMPASIWPSCSSRCTTCRWSGWTRRWRRSSVCSPGGYWYVSEPVYAGDLNELVRVFNDEGTVRAAAQALVDKAAANGRWDRVSDVYF